MYRLDDFYWPEILTKTSISKPWKPKRVYFELKPIACASLVQTEWSILGRMELFNNFHLNACPAAPNLCCNAPGDGRAELFSHLKGIFPNEFRNEVGITQYPYILRELENAALRWKFLYPEKWSKLKVKSAAFSQIRVVTRSGFQSDENQLYSKCDGSVGHGKCVFSGATGASCGTKHIRR